MHVFAIDGMYPIFFLSHFHMLLQILIVTVPQPHLMQGHKEPEDTAR